MCHKQLLWILPLAGLMLTGFTGNFAQESGGGGALGWIGVLIALLLLIPWVIWLRRTGDPEASADHSHHGAESAHQKEAEFIATGAGITPVDLIDAVVDEAEEEVEEVMNTEDDQAAAAPEAKASEPAPVFDASAPTRHVQIATKPDDLTKLEGIGPKISRLLQDKGINTFAELAAASVSQIEGILTEAGIGNIAKPATWPEQAQLAAEGKWDELKTLQDALKGGRRG